MSRSDYRCRTCRTVLAEVREERGSLRAAAGVRATFNVKRRSVTLSCPACGCVREFSPLAKVDCVIVDPARSAPGAS